MVGLSFWPRGVTSAQSLAVLGAVAAWIGFTAVLLVRQLNDPSKTGIAVCAISLVAPLVALTIRRLPVFLFALYAATVPFNSILVTSAGATISKYLGIAVAAAIVFGMLLQKKSLTPPKSLRVLLALLLYTGFMVFWAIDVQKALFTYAMLVQYVAFFAIISVYPFRERDLALVIGATILGGVAASLYGDFLFWHGQQVSGNRLFIGWDADQSIDPNDFAITLLTPIAIALAYFLRCRIGFKKLGYLIVLCVLFSGFVISGSRGGIFAVAAVLLYFLFRSPFKVQMLGLLVPATAAVVASPIAQRLMETDILTADGRTEIWKVGLASLQRYWLIGAGPGNYPNAYDQFYLSTWHSVIEWARPAHSVFLQSAVEYGVAGLALVVVLWYAMFRELREQERDARLGDLCLALRACVLGLFVGGFSLDLLMYKYTWLAFALVAIARASILSRSPEAADQSPRAAILAADT